jgi:cytochrome c-type biogenesis protein CcmI
MTFWLPVIVLLMASAALLVIPVIQANNSAGMSRDEVNAVFYQHRLKELMHDESQGVVVAGQEMVQELQQNLLDDVPVRQDTYVKSINHWALVPGIVLLVLISMSLYINTGAITQVQEWQQVMAQLPQLRARVASPQAAPLNREEIAHFGLGLRTSLQSDENNIHDWMLLGRVLMILNNASGAVQAFAHAWKLDPDNTQATLDYAQALIQSDELHNRQQAAQLLKKIISFDNKNLRAIGLLAFNALEQNNSEEAIHYWASMLPLLPADDERAVLIKMSIEHASKQG